MWLAFQQPWLLTLTLPAWGWFLWRGHARQVTSGRIRRRLLIGGLLLLSIASGEPVWRHAGTGSVAVMVDFSPSTRGANFRHRAWLRSRVDELLGKTPYRLLAFADQTVPLPAGETLADIPCDRTRFTPPPAEAVLLFSDGQFDPPNTRSPVYAVVDPALETPGDAAVEQLQVDAGRAIATVHVSGRARTLSWTPARPTVAISGDQRVATAPLLPGTVVTAQLSSGDRWPENDALQAIAPPPAKLQRWWVGERDPGPGWRRLAPASFPTSVFETLGAVMVVLDDLPAGALSPAQAQTLAGFVHDQGGGLLVLGGQHGLEPDVDPSLAELAPLTPHPPGPTHHWILLGDGSGSMAMASPAGGSLWDAQAAALQHVARNLPPNDSARVGSFAGDVSWWGSAKPADELATQHFPPLGLFPHGPTALAHAIERAAAEESPAGLPKQLLLMTDADADLPDPDALQRMLLDRNVRLSVLAVASGAALPALRAIATATGGHVAAAADPALWSSAGETLVRSAVGDATRREPLDVQFEDAASAIGVRRTTTWERTWLRAGATELARANARLGPPLPMSALWPVGLGRVAAVAFAPSTADASRLAALVERAPRDDRFAVTWEAGPTLAVQVDARDAGRFLDDRNVRLELTSPGETARSLAVPQTAPGRYATQLPAPRRPVLATVVADGAMVDQFAVAGRYAPEFDAIGNNHAVLSSLALSSGGLVIAPGDHRPIHFQWPVRRLSLLAPLALLAAGMILAGLLARR